MARVKSLIVRIEIDQAKRAHKCQANARHRIEAGDYRLNVRNGRSWDRYCVDCARTILARDAVKIAEFRKAFDFAAD